MHLDPTVASLSAGGLAAALVLLWLVSLWRRDASIVDIFWGLGFVFVASVAFVRGQGPASRKGLVLALTAVWGLRLAGYIGWRNHGKPEDARYRAMREGWGARWWWVSLFQVFLLQGVLLWAVSLPLQVAEELARVARLTVLDALGAVVAVVGIALESTGDLQLARWKARPENRGRVMTEGLWRYTRHPNYFGDFCVAWGMYGIALAAGGAWTVVSPLVMSVLLVRVSGVAMTERGMKGRPGFEAYVKRTSAFVPWWPKG